MKKIYLSEEDKKELFDRFTKEFDKEVENYNFSVNNKSFGFKADFNKVAEEKITIVYTREAYLRMQALVDYFSTEVGWYGLVEKLDDKTYVVYDVKVCQQYVNGAKVDTEDEEVLEFFESLTDEEAEHLHFQAHSHVNMSTSASATDLQNQADVIKNMGKTGFYIFQIWNKKNEISTYLYDLDNNIFYDSKDVYIEIEDELGTISDFIVSVADLVCEKKKYPYQWDGNNYYGEGWKWVP